MNYNPVEYKPFDRVPIGCFTAEMTANGWANTMFDHDLQERLLSEEVGEFVRLVYHFFKDCADWTKLGKYIKKYGTKVKGDGYGACVAFNYAGNALDYVVQVEQTSLKIFPYRKIKH